MYLLLVEVAVGAYLISYADSFHVDDFGARKLISVLNWTLSNLLVHDGVIDGIADCLLIGGCVEVLVTLVGVLISLYTLQKISK